MGLQEQFVFLCVNKYICAKVFMRISGENSIQLVLQSWVQYTNISFLPARRVQHIGWT